MEKNNNKLIKIKDLMCLLPSSNKMTKNKITRVLM